MKREQLTWFDVKDVASSMFNIMGNGKEIVFAENVWQKLSELGLTSYSNNFERVKIAILFFAIGDLYRDFCTLVYDKNTKFAYSDLLIKMNIDELTLGRFYQEYIKPIEKKLPDDFDSNKAVEELSKYFRKDIYKFLLKACGSSFGLLAGLWRSTYPYSDEDNLTDIQILYFSSITPEKEKAHSWIENGCYVLL